MRTLWAAIAAALLLCTPAKSEPSAWHDGAYAGITIGYGAGAFEAEGINLGADGVLAGGYVGYGKIVMPGGVYLGIEADAMLKDLSGSSDVLGINVKGSGDYLASIRGRVGYAVGPALLYATAGPALTTMRLSATDGIDSVADSKRVFGVVGGLGIDAQITPTMTLRLEGLHYWFPDRTLNLDGADVKTGQQETVVRAGISFKLF